MVSSFLKPKKALLTCILVLMAVYCSAQKQLLTYQDLQYLLQNNTAAATTFLQQKEYHLQTSANGEARFFGLMADEDYNDVDFNTHGRRTTLTLLTTNVQQLEIIQNSLQNQSYKNTKNGKVYRIKNDAISSFSIKLPVDKEKVYTVLIEN